MTSRETYPLLAADYDGTIALTGEVPIDGTDVSGAYARAISDRMGEETGQEFVERGGHLHRTPLEIVTDLRPDLRPETARRIALSVTADKLDILQSQIGRPLANGGRWPRPTEGFEELWQRAHAFRSDGGTIATAVISAGHTSFIKKWFEVFDLEDPDCIVSAEVVDNLALNVPLAETVKPAPLPMRIAEAALVSKYEGSGYPLVYAGDDLHKDGGLAANTDAHFILIEQATSAQKWQEAATILGLPAREGGA